jgi:predicted alpha-1,2-mannosidase
MRKVILLFFALCLLYINVKAQKLTQFVDVFIGTGGHGHTYPGATVPFGMVQLSPDNGTQGWDWSSGYHYSDSTIAGFSHTHLSGTGIGDWCDISVMPLDKPISNQTLSTKFSHANEQASPGFYSVKLDNGIVASFTATQRCGLHKYEFPGNSQPVIQIDLGFAINWDSPTQTYIKILNDSTLIGYRFSTGWAKNQKVYFAARTSQKFTSTQLLNNQQSIHESEITGTLIKGQLYFANAAGKTVMMKVALSSLSTAKALIALQEIKDWNFNKVKTNAQAQWETELQKIQIKTPNQAFKRTFYTALYHTCLAPVLFSDADGAYQNSKNEIIKPNGQQRYTVYSLWDTFRALNPLFTITQPRRYPDILNSMLAFYKQNGLLPVWDLSTWETGTMTGYHAIPVLADAILKNTPGLDALTAYNAMKKSATQTVRGVPDYIKYGYLPQDKGGWSVTVTLEYAFDDYCIAQVAKKLNFMADYKTYTKRSLAYKLLFDKNTGFIRARNSDGKFTLPFDPYYSQHDNKAEYVEGNAWQHSFFVPHSPRGLAMQHGSYKNFTKKLDSLFTVSSILTGKNTSNDVSGFVGQYAHGNEPSHHIAYLYTFVGEAYKTQEKVRLIADSMYHSKPDGYAGNEDCGQMSAWLVWSAAGFYPANPASGQYVFGSPLANEILITLPNKKKMLVIAKNNSVANKYIQKVTLNGKPYTKTYISHSALLAGGKLVFYMGATPNKTWGANAKYWPSSID